MSDKTTNPDKGANLVRHSGTKSSVDHFIDVLQQAEKLAKYVSESKTFGKAFQDEEGKISEGDIVAAIVLGSELGIKPMSAITLGRRLNADAYFKVMKGKALGLDPISSLNSVSIIDTKNGPVIHTGVSVITKVLIDAGVQFEFLEDYTPVYKYVNAKTGTEVDYDRHKDRIYIIDKETSKEDLEKASKEDKILTIKKLATRRTTISFDRVGFKPFTISYTLQDATDAGLYKGITSDGVEVDGKANWNNHPATMLRNRPLTIGGRIVCGDRLQSTYSNDEASEFTDYEFVKEDFETIKDNQENDLVN